MKRGSGRSAGRYHHRPMRVFRAKGFGGKLLGSLKPLAILCVFAAAFPGAAALLALSAALVWGCIVALEVRARS